MRERKPFYAYKGLGQLVRTISQGTTRRQRREMGLIGEREARLLFRVTNFFNPQHILQVGASTGVESVAMLAVNNRSRLYLYDRQLDQKPLAVRVLRSQMDRVECFDDENVAISAFLEAQNDDSPLMALVNGIVDETMLKPLLDAGVVLVMRNLNRDKAMSSLFETCCDVMPMGQTYTNNKIAILNPNPKLQREDFLLWL